MCQFGNQSYQNVLAVIEALNILMATNIMIFSYVSN